jgi:hypothetical protein
MGDSGSLLVMENRRHIADFSFYHQVAGYNFPPAIPDIYSNIENVVLWGAIKALSRAESSKYRKSNGLFMPGIPILAPGDNSTPWKD